MHEYQTLKGDEGYTNAINDKGNELNLELQIKILQILYYLFDIGFEKEANEAIQENKLPYKNFEEVKKQLTNKIFDRDVMKLKTKESDKKEVRTFENMCVDLETSFNMIFKTSIQIPENITVARFAAYENKIINYKPPK